jgi:aryl-alcohol dehydrogenase-like predicted oxidoreductase
MRIGGDLEVGRIGYGAMRLTGPNLWGDYPDRNGGIALMRQAVEAGVDLIDTADVYGRHTNELLIHDALHQLPATVCDAQQPCLMSTKRASDNDQLEAVR